MTYQKARKKAYAPSRRPHPVVRSPDGTGRRGRATGGRIRPPPGRPVPRRDRSPEGDGGRSVDRSVDRSIGRVASGLDGRFPRRASAPGVALVPPEGDSAASTGRGERSRKRWLNLSGSRLERSLCRAQYHVPVRVVYGGSRSPPWDVRLSTPPPRRRFRPRDDRRVARRVLGTYRGAPVRRVRRPRPARIPA